MQLIWSHWPYKMPVRYIVSSVWVRLSKFSQLFILQYLGLCVFSLPISLAMIERLYILLSYYHHQIRIMNHCPNFRARSWNNAWYALYVSLYSYYPSLPASNQYQQTSNKKGLLSFPSNNPSCTCWQDGASLPPRVKWELTTNWNFYPLLLRKNALSTT